MEYRLIHLRAENIYELNYVKSKDVLTVFLFSKAPRQPVGPTRLPTQPHIEGRGIEVPYRTRTTDA
jgi:hypothetical protein